MLDMNLLPADLLNRACARIRWQQRLLCCLSDGESLEVGERDTLGLYYTLEDIFEDITAAIRKLDESPAA